jgi:sarcosine oxidase subunit beta
MVETAETVIVGGGIAGVALAYELASGGATEVVVVDRGELGGGATGYSMGGVRQQFSTPLEIELSKRGLAFWRGVEETFDSPCPFFQDGYLFVTARAELLDKLRAAADLQRALGAGPVEMLTPEGIAKLLPWLDPTGLVGACWTPDDGRVTPTDGVAALARAARRLGVRFREHWPVSTLRRQAGGFTVEGPEPLRAARVVVACGIWTPPLLAPFGLDVDISPMLLHYALTAPALRGQAVPLTIDLETGLCVEREGDGLALTVLAEDLPDSYGAEDMIAEFGAAAAVRAPGLTDVGIRQVISAQADLSGDGHPYVGEVDDGLWVIAGFGGHGTMHGPVVAELLAATMLGRPDPAIGLEPLDPHRSRPIGDEEWLVASRKA